MDGKTSVKYLQSYIKQIWKFKISEVDEWMKTKKIVSDKEKGDNDNV